MLRRIEDSRGRMRAVFPVAAAWVDDPNGPPDPSRGTGPGLFFVAPIGALVLLVATRMPHPERIFAGVFGSALLIAGLVLLVVNPRRPAGSYIAFTSLLSNGYCPACAYRIDTVRPAPDGCTVCPECGAAWRR